MQDFFNMIRFHCCDWHWTHGLRFLRFPTSCEVVLRIWKAAGVGQPPINQLHPRSLIARPWKMMVGRLLSLWDCKFSGAMLNFQGVLISNYKLGGGFNYSSFSPRKLRKSSRSIFFRWVVQPPPKTSSNHYTLNLWGNKLLFLSISLEKRLSPSSSCFTNISSSGWRPGNF